MHLKTRAYFILASTYVAKPSALSQRASILWSRLSKVLHELASRSRKVYHACLATYRASFSTTPAYSFNQTCLSTQNPSAGTVYVPSPQRWPVKRRTYNFRPVRFIKLHAVLL